MIQPTLLTMEQKKIIISMNHFIGKYNDKIEDGTYGNTPAYNILDRWITEIIGEDYRKDVYDNVSIFELNKIESIKKKFLEKYDEGWFIGDALKNSLYTLCHRNVQDEVLIDVKEQELKDMWIYFKGLLPTPKEKYHYIDAGVTANGEKLYKRVEK